MGDFLTGVKLERLPEEPGSDAHGVADGATNALLPPRVPDAAAVGVKVATGATLGVTGATLCTFCTQLDT